MGKPRYPKRDDGYRSGLEAALGGQLDGEDIEYEYETLTVPYVQPATGRRYKPDFILPNGIIIEAKGRFKSSHRKKHLMVRDSHPGLDIRFVFSRSSTRLSKRSKTTYAQWCESKGFPYADKLIPKEWIQEPPNEESLATLEEIRQHRLNT